MEGKLIVIEGNDCSGKETQSNMLKERLKRDGYDVFEMAFPRYDTPTGKIVGGPLLGKSHICETYFEDVVKLNPKVAGLYYVADRLYNLPEIEKNLEEGKVVILDRYTISNMAHQGSKKGTSEERQEIFEFYDKLEFDMLGLPRPDAVILLHMPHENVMEIMKNRDEPLDEVEKSPEHFKRSEDTYLQLKDLYGFKYVSCVNGGNVRTREDISEEVYGLVKEILND